MLPRKEDRNLRSSNCWKCIQIVNPTTTTLYLYYFISFSIQSGGLFWFLGEGVRPHPPCLRACFQFQYRLFTLTTFFEIAVYMTIGIMLNLIN